MKDEALRLALEALKSVADHRPNDETNAAITAIKQALANDALDKMADNERELGIQMEPEPVGYLYVSDPWGAPEYNFSLEKENEYSQPLYTSPPKRKPLTDEELKPICDEYRILFGYWVNDFARAIEAKLKEKNT